VLRVHHGQTLPTGSGLEALVGHPELDWRSDLLPQPQRGAQVDRVEATQRVSTHEPPDGPECRFVDQNLVIDVTMLRKGRGVVNRSEKERGGIQSSSSPRRRRRVSSGHDEREADGGDGEPAPPVAQRRSTPSRPDGRASRIATKTPKSTIWATAACT